MNQEPARKQCKIGCGLKRELCGLGEELCALGQGLCGLGSRAIYLSMVTATPPLEDFVQDVRVAK